MHYLGVDTIDHNSDLTCTRQCDLLCRVKPPQGCKNLLHKLSCNCAFSTFRRMVFAPRNIPKARPNGVRR